MKMIRGTLMRTIRIGPTGVFDPECEMQARVPPGPVIFMLSFPNFSSSV